eukprot:Rhum_TRINITY_DN8486_c0_g2::Rhum_TRINITY_DN8486_c0_g2_i1::g.28166::m.28166
MPLMTRAIVLLAALCTCTVVAVTHTVASDTQLEGLADLGTSADRKRLECSVCKCVVRDLQADLKALHKLRRGKPKYYEVEDVLDGVCRRFVDRFGILRRNNKPANVFTSNKKISMMQGAWINAFFESRCGDLMDVIEDRMREDFLDYDVDALRAELCKEEASVCTDAHLADNQEDL